ncbi:hypothetical protein HII31_06574 [Pseudocercospora fuligena]|uniref:Uncharacterized protein n=1 Tax=Pseudocercospora fuligena TaxID=685502 RepID=A0A8H6R5H0_9PEZI|nr:hypothetical protein HII31_13764 [Pseudocercospora fuligena]KAF7192188.1 hypothetical protein HII31_06574 [Pseudocercospora fuligena]
MQALRELAFIDKLAKRSKQSTCIQNGIKSDPEELSIQPEEEPRLHPEEEQEEEEEDQACDKGNDSDGSYTPTTKRKKVPKKPTANATKRRKVTTENAPPRSQVAGPSRSGQSTEHAAAATSASSTQPSAIEVCLQSVATMPEDWPIVAEAVKILVNHRLPSAASASLNGYEDLATWVGAYECMQKYDTDTVEHVVDVLTSAEAKSIVDRVVSTVKSPRIIEAIHRKFGEHMRGQRAASGAVSSRRVSVEREKRDL